MWQRSLSGIRGSVRVSALVLRLTDVFLPFHSDRLLLGIVD